MASLKDYAFGFYLRAIAQVGAVATLVTALAVTALLAYYNPSLTAAGVIELGIAMLWLELVAQAVLIAGLVVVWFPLGKLMRWGTRDWRSYLIFGLFACHVGGLLLGRLTLTQTWIRMYHVITWPGLAQCAALGLMAISIVIAGVWLRDPARRRFSPFLALFALVMGTGCMFWDSRREEFQRKYPLEEIRTAASTDAAVAVSQTEEPAPVALLGLDGMEWSVMKPLLEAGRLPNFATLIQRGAIGYLDNGELSYSPVIWNTIFTGRSEAEHDIHDFRALILPRTGQVVSEFPVMPPTPHAFYGIRHLVETIPSAGFWRTHQATSTERRVKTIWDIASGFEKQVAVANPLTSTPVQPVYGSMIVYRTNTDPSFAYPPELAAEWGATLARSGSPRRDWLEEYARPENIRARSRIEAEFTLELFDREGYDLGVYYEPLVDEMGHLGWNFYDRDSAVIMDLPSRLSNRQWEELVLAHAEESVFAAYEEMDVLLGEFLSREPVNIVVVSDHGWTFSGYEHYGSPNGIIILSGPAFRPGVNLAGACIEDIAPTVLGVMGIPLSRELRGKPLLGALREEPRLTEVASYGPPVHTRDASAAADDEEELERLKALGYIQ